MIAQPHAFSCPALWAERRAARRPLPNAPLRSTHPNPLPADMLQVNVVAVMADLRREYKPLMLRWYQHSLVLAGTATAAFGLLAAAHLIRAGGPDLPLFAWASQVVQFPELGWSTDMLSLVTEWPAAALLNWAAMDAFDTALETWRVRRLHRAAAAKRRSRQAPRGQRGAAQRSALC